MNKTGLLIWMIGILCTPTPALPAETLKLTRDQCIELALQNNRQRKISQYDVEIAQALLAQAQSAYWPSLSAGVVAGVLDEPLVFTYPATQGTLTIPPGVIGPNPVPMDLDLPSHTIDIMDDKVAMATISLDYPLYTGGIRKAINQQAQGNLELAKQGVVRTELAIIHDIDRAYYGAILARKLEKVAEDTLARMTATLSLTERLYQEGTGSVKKTDYLRNKSMVEIIRSATYKIEAQRLKADAALIYLTGLERSARIEPAGTDLPCLTEAPAPEQLIQAALESNPDLIRIKIGLLIADARIDEATGGYKPKIGLTAKYMHIENDLDTGLMDPKNKDIGAIGIAAQLPLFEGFKTQNSVLEARLEREKLRMQQEALIEGIALRIDHAHAELASTVAREKSNSAGLEAATENRKLNIRAYQEGLVETSDVIQAQIAEAILTANHLQTRYQCLISESQLNLIIGKETRPTPVKTGE